MVSDERLMAYVDGELSAAESASVEAQVAADPVLRQRVAVMREGAALLQGAFDEALQGPMPPLRAFQRARSRRGFWSLLSEWFGAEQSLRWQPVALCALVLAVVSGGTGYWVSSERQLQDFRSAGVMTPVETQELERVLNQALETRLSGQSVDWHDVDTGRGGVITPVRTFKTEQGRFCREFTDKRGFNGGANVQRGIACRDGQGSWRVRVRYFL